MDLITRKEKLDALLLDEVVRRCESEAVYQTEQRIRALARARRDGDPAAGDVLAAEVAGLSPNAARVLAADLTTHYDLMNIAEDKERITILHRRALHPPIRESLADTIGQLKAQGVTYAQMAQLIESLRVEIVLTAHPTESKRRAVAARVHGIFTIADDVALPVPKALTAEITTLWLTDRARTAQPEVTDEVRAGLYFVREILWDVAPRIREDLNAAFESHYPGLVAPPTCIALASWIGGDRDGNPSVDDTITAESLRLHRGQAIEIHRRRLRALAQQLSVSDRRCPPPRRLSAWLEANQPLPIRVARLAVRYAREPYRLALELVAEKLRLAGRDLRTMDHLMGDAPHGTQITVDEITQVLDWIAAGIPPILARQYLEPLRAELAIFGLHATHLDIREHSEPLRAALAEMLAKLGVHQRYTDLDRTERTALLRRLLAEPCPAIGDLNASATGPESARTWRLFRLLARAHRVYGRKALGSLIVSMTHSADDILGVVLLARWARVPSGLSIVPLFETLEDLEVAPSVLDELFSLPPYQAHLRKRNHEQTCMVGYSDSNKDGGYLAANWALYRAQERIAEACDRHQVALTLFHGRGGTIARGGGPAARAIRAQPPNTVRGRFRLTEQGETIALRYANRDLAHRHLQQIVSAVLQASVGPPVSAVEPAWRSCMAQIAEVSCRAYRNLLHETPGFYEFWQHATPIDEISRLRLGSRPPARRSGALTFRDVRAIPWVFSWMQSRFNLPGWYGLGTAIASADRERLFEMYQSWPFWAAILDNAEMSLLKADMDIAALYVDLVRDREAGARIFRRIRDEYDRTRDGILAVTGHKELMDAEPVIQESVKLRNPYVDPLNYLQVEMLRRLRALSDSEGPEAEPYREVIVMTINGVSAGLRNTG